MCCLAGALLLEFAAPQWSQPPATALSMPVVAHRSFLRPPPGPQLAQRAASRGFQGCVRGEAGADTSHAQYRLPQAHRVPSLPNTDPRRPCSPPTPAPSCCPLTALWRVAAAPYRPTSAARPTPAASLCGTCTLSPSTISARCGSGRVDSVAWCGAAGCEPARALKCWCHVATPSHPGRPDAGVPRGRCQWLRYRVYCWPCGACGDACPREQGPHAAECSGSSIIELLHRYPFPGLFACVADFAGEKENGTLSLCGGSQRRRCPSTTDPGASGLRTSSC